MLQVNNHMPSYSQGLGNFILCSCSHGISQTQSKLIIYSLTSILFGKFVAHCFHLYTPLFAVGDCVASLCLHHSSDPHHPTWAACTDSYCLIKFSYWQDFSGKYVHWRLLVPMAYSSNTDRTSWNVDDILECCKIEFWHETAVILLENKNMDWQMLKRFTYYIF